MPDKLSAEIPPEKELLICCARTRLNPETVERIRELLTRDLDWTHVFEEAAENAIRPLLFQQLLAVGPEKVPQAWMERLRESCRANAIRNLLLTAQLLTILHRLEGQQILAIPYKGPVLAAQAYGDVALREFEDLDFILPQEDLPAAHEQMIGLGFEPKFPWVHSAFQRKSFIPGEYSYVDRARRIVVELHTELTLRHFPEPLDLREFRRRLVQVSLGPGEVLTFSAEDQIPILCVHGSKDFWERLSWVTDIVQLVTRPGGIRWEEAMAQAHRLRVERMTHLGLTLATDLFGVELPEEVLGALRADLKAIQLAKQVKERLLALERPPLSASQRFRWRVGMMTSFARGLHYVLHLTMTPSEEDWLTERLPRPLRPLASVLRPLRLLRKYGPRASIGEKSDR